MHKPPTPQAIVVDPPRHGLDESVISHAAGMQPERDYRLWIAPRDGPGTMIRF